MRRHFYGSCGTDVVIGRNAIVTEVVMGLWYVRATILPGVFVTDVM